MVLQHAMELLKKTTIGPKEHLAGRLKYSCE